MKTITLILMALLPFITHAQTDSTKMLPAGTVITISLLQDISSKTSEVGDVLMFETSEPVIIGDRVMVPKGAGVTGKITESERAKGLGKAGTLNFTIDWLKVGSKNVKLSGEQKTKGSQKTGTAVAEAVLLSPLFLLKKGKNKKFEKGHIFKVFVDSDTKI